MAMASSWAGAAVLSIGLTLIGCGSTGPGAGGSGGGGAPGGSGGGAEVPDGSGGGGGTPDGSGGGGGTAGGGGGQGGGAAGSGGAVSDAGPEQNSDAAPDHPEVGPAAICGNGSKEGAETCDPPDDTTCDSACQIIPTACADGRTQPGEQCDVHGSLCVACHFTPYIACLYNSQNVVPFVGTVYGADTVCPSLTGSARHRCELLMNCIAQGLFACSGNNNCYCSKQDCSTGLDGTCGPEGAAFIGSSNPAELKRQLSMSSPLSTINAEAEAYIANSGCRPRPLTAPSYGLVINEIDYRQPGGDTAEFVEIVNGADTPIDMTGYQLRLFNVPTAFGTWTAFLSVPLSGVIRPDEYLVVGTTSLEISAAVRKLYFPQPQDNIPNDGRTGFELLNASAGIVDIFDPDRDGNRLSESGTMPLSFTHRTPGAKFPPGDNNGTYVDSTWTTNVPTPGRP
jgi:hypothetical protein